MGHVILGRANGRRHDVQAFPRTQPSSAWESSIIPLVARCLTPGQPEPLALAELRSALTAAEVDWSSLLTAASRLLVAPSLYDPLIAKNLWNSLPDAARDYLSCVHSLNTHRNTLLLKQAEHLAALLNGVGIEPLLLKGIAYLVQGLHPSPGSRVMSDIDILVAENEVSRARYCLERAGWRLMQPLPANIPVDTHMHFVYAYDNAPARVELHQAFMEFGQRHLLPGSDLLSAAKPATLENGARVLLLPAQESVIVNIVHSHIRGGCHRLGVLALRSLYDLVLLCQRHDDPIDWTAMLEWFEGRGWRRALHARLFDAAELFSMPLHPTVSQDLNFKLSMARIRLLRRFTYLRLLVHACNQVPRTARSLGWRTIGYYAKRATQPDFYYHLRRLLH